MTNCRMLQDTIKESGYQKSYIASQMGLKSSTFSSKLNGHTAFKPDEINALCDLLKLKKRQRRLIFYPEA